MYVHNSASGFFFFCLFVFVFVFVLFFLQQQQKISVVLILASHLSNFLFQVDGYTAEAKIKPPFLSQPVYILIDTGCSPSPNSLPDLYQLDHVAIPFQFTDSDAVFHKNI